MILGAGSRLANSTATLDDLFRRAGVRLPDALALADPPNREVVTHDAPRKLSFAQADRAISALAARLRGIGLQTDAVIAMQLPNTVESVITVLGVLRAGMIAAPMPLLWRRHDIVAALRNVGTKAIITSSRIGSAAHADIAMQAAVELFPIRHVCSFGRDLPDGIVPLDDVFDPRNTDVFATPNRSGPAAAHVAAVTFGLDAKGPVPIARNHAELTSGGLAIFLEADIAPDTPLLSTIPTGSFAGIVLTILPWLLSGGALHLHHGFDPNTLAAQCRSLKRGVVVLPEASLTPLATAGLPRDEIQMIIALSRAPERLALAMPWEGTASVVDVTGFGDIGLVATRRGADGMPAPLTLGAISAPRQTVGAITVIETARSNAGTLTLRGPMVPAHAFPPGAERGQDAHLAPDAAGYVDTGFACRLERAAQTLTVTAPPPGTIGIGGYRFLQREVETLIGQADPDATVVPLPDADLGQRLAGTTANRSALRAELQARGVNPLISGAFQPRGAPEAA
ncbi:MAG: class I adenylate-forming enzyme family protein [Pseudolabrys sp.]